MRKLPSGKWRGLTVDDVDRIPEVIQALAKLPFRTFVRVVVDYPERPLSDYDRGIEQLATVADVMVQVRDSYAEKESPLSVDAYVALFEAMFLRWQNWVTLWEVGNEVNGNWLPPDIAHKVTGCLISARSLGARTAVTFYLERSGAMAEWARQNLQGLRPDVALISWYPRANRKFHPNWNLEVSWLSVACGGDVLVGGGEFGTEDENGDQLADMGTATTIRVVEATVVDAPTWIGGWFFWDFCKWCLPPKRLCFRAWRDGFR